MISVFHFLFVYGFIGLTVFVYSGLFGYAILVMTPYWKPHMKELFFKYWTPPALILLVMFLIALLVSGIGVV